MEIGLETLEPRQVVCLRHIGPYEECHQAWNKLFIWAGKKGLVTEKTLPIGLSYDDPQTVPADQLRYDACITIDEDFSGEDEFKVMTIGGGDYAKYVHIGKFSKIMNSFQEMIKEISQKTGHKIRDGACLEIYLDDPEDVPEEQCRTELYVPVE